MACRAPDNGKGARPFPMSDPTPGAHAFAHARQTSARGQPEKIHAGKPGQDARAVLAPNRYSRFRRFRNRLIFGDPFKAISGPLRAFGGKVDFVYADLRNVRATSATARETLPERQLLSRLRGLLSDCGNICVRCRSGQTGKLRRDMDSVFGENQFVRLVSPGKQQTAADSGSFIIYGESSVRIYNHFVADNESIRAPGARAAVTAQLLEIINTHSSAGSLAVLFLCDEPEAIIAAEISGRHWIAIESIRRAPQTMHARLERFHAAHASHKPFRPFDIF